MKSSLPETRSHLLSGHVVNSVTATKLWDMFPPVGSGGRRGRPLNVARFVVLRTSAAQRLAVPDSIFGLVVGPLAAALVCETCQCSGSEAEEQLAR